MEEDKKNAAKLNALVRMVPSTDWPERKEPPEYSNPPKATYKQKPAMKEQLEHGQQHHPNERRKVWRFFFFFLSSKRISNKLVHPYYLFLLIVQTHLNIRVYLGRRTTTRSQI